MGICTGATPSCSEEPTSGMCNHTALPGQIHITRLVHGSQLHVSSSAGLRFWPAGHTIKTWTFPQATKPQLPGHFWPVGHGFHTPDLNCQPNENIVSKKTL